MLKSLEFDPSTVFVAVKQYGSNCRGYWFGENNKTGGRDKGEVSCIIRAENERPKTVAMGMIVRGWIRGE